MSDFFASSPSWIGRLAAAGLELSVRIAVLIAVVGFIDRVLGRGRVLARAALWNACVLGLLVLPLTMFCIPRLSISCLRARPTMRGPVASIPDPAQLEANPLPADTELGGHPTGLGEVGPAARNHDVSVARTPAAAGPGSEPVRRATTFPRARRTRPPIDGVAAILLVYALGLLVMLGRLVGSILAVARLSRSGEAVTSSPWLSALARWRERLDIASKVHLRRTGRVTVPAVVGGLRPTILLPAKIGDDTEPAIIDAILLHELCHVRRGDYTWNLVLRVVEALYWPHPFVWFASRCVGRVREQVCDELCVNRLADASGYRAMLIDVAATLVRRPGPSLGLAMARTSRLEKRLARIDQSRGIAQCVLRRPARLAMGVGLILGVGLIGTVRLSRAAATQAETPNLQAAPSVNLQATNQAVAGEASKTFDFLALDDATGKPLPDVTIRVRSAYDTRFVTTNAKGLAKVPRPEADYGPDPAYTYSVSFWKDAYVQDRKAWSDYDPSYTPIPASFTARLKRGAARIGGTVTDETGAAIAGATIELSEPTTNRKAGRGILSDLPVTTDAQGRWTTESVPPEPTGIRGSVKHPEFLNGSMNAPLDAMLAGKGDVVLKRGSVIEGRVLDDLGKPIAGASVVAVDFSSLANAPKTESRADGRFRLANLLAGVKTLVVSAPGRTPEMRPIQAGAPQPPFEFRLGPGKTLKGRVVDSTGEPIAGAAITAVVAIAGSGPRDETGLVWRSRSDAEGRFVWDSAPSNEVRVIANRRGSSIVVHNVRAGDAEQTWVLAQSFRVHGTVTDARTGWPIRRFEFKSSANVSPSSPPRTGLFPNTGLFGKYDLKLQQAPGGFTFSITAEGYKPFTSRRFPGDETDVVYDAKLERLAPGEGGGPTGVVLGLDAKPLAGADVEMGQAVMPVTLRNGAVYAPDSSVIAGVGFVLSGDDGTFTFHPTKDRFELAVIHETGFARISGVELAKTHTARIRPWGRIEGRVAPELKGKGDEIEARVDHLYLPVRPGERPTEALVSATYQSIRPEPNGRFVIERVMPGPMIVELHSSRARLFTIARIRTEIRSGETANVSFGAIGRAVVGRLEPASGEPPLPPGMIPPRLGSPHLSSAQPSIPLPVDLLKSGDIDRQSAWAATWAETLEGKAYRDVGVRGATLELERSGALHADWVAPGDYYISIRLRDSKQPQPANFVMAWKRVRIPDGPAGSTFDVGAIPARHLGHPEPGDPAPPIVAETLGGKPFRLADLRGKFVVLNFWSSNNDRSRYQIADMEGVRKKFGDDPRLAIVGLNCDVDRDAARKFIAEVGQPWTQVALGDWSDTAVPASYGVERLTTTVLVGPDGKILSTLGSNASLEQELSKLLDRK
jgi:beta-lactamase regulating signal transducer with metallopeptidase domain